MFAHYLSRPGGLRSSALAQGGALGSLLGRPGENTMRHRACSTESFETRRASHLGFSGAHLRIESRKSRERFHFFGSSDSSGMDGGLKAPGAHFTV